MEDNGKEILQEQQTYSTFHSDEVQEIMGRQPAWILRWGITVLILILMGIIWACYFIKYPQTVTAAVTLTSDNPPSDLMARSTGILDSVYVYDGARVCRGELIAMVSNAADYKDVVRVEEHLESGTKSLPVEWQDYVLGDLQQAWITYLAALSDYEDYCRIDRIGRKKELITSQVKQSEDYYGRLEVQRKTLEKEMEYEKIAVSRDSALLSKAAISHAEYEDALKALASKQSSLAGFDASMSNTRLNTMQLEQQIFELETQRTEETAGYEHRIEQSRNTLISNISQWKEQYAIIAPFDGTVSLQNVWSSGQHVSAGSLIASVIPNTGADVVGRLKVPSSGFGKVEVGQEVNIKLNGFPYLEFGILKGEVKSISSVPEKSEYGLCYTVMISLPQGLESTYHKSFPYVQDMDGTAEIIIEDMRLIEQFIRPIRSLFVNR